MYLCCLPCLLKLYGTLPNMNACVCRSLAQVPSAACAGVGPVQPGDSVSWSVRWLPVRVPGTWCRPEVQESQTYRAQYVCLPELKSTECSIRGCVFSHSPLPFQSHQTTRWSMGVRRCCWMRESPTTWAACLEGLNLLLWLSGLKMVCLWRGLPVPL